MSDVGLMFPLIHIMQMKKDTALQYRHNTSCIRISQLMDQLSVTAVVVALYLFGLESQTSVRPCVGIRNRGVSARLPSVMY